MRFDNLRTMALAVAAAALITPALAAQTDSKQLLNPTTTTARIAIAVIAMSPGPGTVDLQWDAVRSAVGYRIERRKVDSELVEGPRVPAAQFFAVADGHPTNRYTDTGLWNGATYEYRVTAVFDSKATAVVVTSGSVKVTTAP